MAEAARRLKTNRKIEGKSCGWCGTALVLGDDAAVCEACESEHHAACWDQKGGCSRDTCSNAPLKQLDAQGPTAAAGPAPAGPWGRAAAPRQKPPLGPGMKYCPTCNNGVLAEAQICNFCNQILSPDGIYHGPVINAPGAVSSMVYGIIGLFICGIIFGILAIVKAREAKASIAYNPRHGGGGMATAGMVLGIIDLVGWAILMVYNLSRLSGS